MQDSQFLIIIGVLLVSMVLTGFVAVLYLRRLLASKMTPKQYTIHVDSSKFFTELDSEEVRSLVHDKLITTTAKAARQFEEALTKAIPKMINDIDNINAKAMQKEFEKFQADVQALSAEAMQDQFKLQEDVSQRRQELMAALDKEIVKQYRKRMAEFDNRFNDVVSSFLIETLGNHADLGAQMPHILEQLEVRKDEIKKDML